MDCVSITTAITAHIPQQQILFQCILTRENADVLCYKNVIVHKLSCIKIFSHPALKMNTIECTIIYQKLKHSLQNAIDFCPRDYFESH